MKPLTRTLLLALCAVAPLAAQGPYYVNGKTGNNNPGAGTTPTNPWKTIGYALATIPRPPSAGVNYQLFVEGNQVYSPSTNGESFPVRPAYNIWIEGSFAGHGILPRLVGTTGATMLLFDPNETYNRNQVTLRYLVFEGGAIAAKMGAAPGQRHRPRFQDCEFSGQTTACVRVEEGGQAICDPRFFQNTFRNSPRAFSMSATGNASILYPDIEENTFRGLTNAGIYLEDTSPTGGNVGASIHSNWFTNSFRGVHMRSGLQASTTNFSVTSCSFTDIGSEAVYLEITGPSSPTATVSMSSFVRAGTGMRCDGVGISGSTALIVERCSAKSCQNGFWFDVGGAGSASVVSRSNLADTCGTGFTWNASSNQITAGFNSLGDRALRNATGMTVSGTSPNAFMSLQSAIFGANTGTGLNVTSSYQVLGRSLTLADNATGLFANANGPRTLDHLVFTGNTNHVAGGAPTINYSCFEAATWPGIGNLNNTNPLVVRPFYKLAPNSPCIDKGNIATNLPATDYEGDPRAAVSKIGGQPLPDLGADEYIQLGSVRKYGTPGFGYFNFFPEISSPNTKAIINGSLTIALENAILPVFQVPANGAVLTFGTRDDSGSLPFELSAFGAPGSLLWNEINATFGPFPVNAQGSASVTFVIPSNAFLIGQTFTFQWLAQLQNVNTLGVVSSDGLRVTIGQ